MAQRDRSHDVKHPKSARLVHHRKVKTGAAGSFGSAAVRGKLATEQAPGQWAPDHQAKLLVLQQGQHFALQIPPGNRVIGLHTLKARPVIPLGDRQRLHDLPGRHIAQPDVAHLAGSHHVVEGGQHIFQWCQRVKAVQLVQVDVIELQALQAGVELIHQVVA